jgi:hypothetical protein
MHVGERPFSYFPMDLEAMDPTARAFLDRLFAPAPAPVRTPVTDLRDSFSPGASGLGHGQLPFAFDQELLMLLISWLTSELQKSRDLGAMQPRSFGNVQPSSWPSGHSGGQSGGGGGSPGAAPSGSPVRVNAPPGTQLSANAPWISQFDGSQVERAGSDACYRACRAMMAAAGFTQPPGLQNRIQVATGEDGNGRASVDPAKAAEAQKFIDSQLEAGKPVTVGVTYKDDDYNEGITDHFVVVTGKGVDEQGRVFYTYQDPGTQNAESGTNRRFYVDEATGNLYDPNPMFGGRFDLSMVVPAS